jgi:putative cell wall-binding protein
MVLSLLAGGAALAQTAPAGQVTSPSDAAFTVGDAAQATGRRMNLPSPDCAVHKSECAEVALINGLDGFDLDPRITVQLDSRPSGDLAALFGEDVLHVRRAGTTERIGLNRLVLDPATNRLFGHPVEQLREATTYEVVYRGQLTRFTTLSATAGLVQMRRQLDDGSAYASAGIAPAQRGISFTQGDLRTVFPTAQVALINRYDEVVPNGELRSEMVLDSAQLTANLGGTYAFGSLRVPSWLDASATIPQVPTGGRGPTVRGFEDIGVTVILPSGPKPAGGWPVAIFGPGITRSKYDIYLVSDFNAARGIATVSFDPVGHAFGPRSEVGVQLGSSRDEVRFSGFGRGRDRNNDGIIENREGVQAPLPPHPLSSIGLRDGLRQTAADVMAIARAIRLGTDVDGDGENDLDGADISFYALSLGGIYGTMLMGSDNSLEVAALNVPGGPIADIARLGNFRSALTVQLRNRIPAQLNGGRAQFDESLPLFLDPPVASPAPGAVAIQDTVAGANWISRPGSPEAFAPRLERFPQQGAQPKRVIYQFAFGDQTVPNPTSATLARAFGNFEQVAYYRNDRTATRDTNPHGLLADPRVQGRNQAQLQAIEWLASGGTRFIDPDGDPGSPAQSWETPIVDRDALERTNFSDDVRGPVAPAPSRSVLRLFGPTRIGTAAAISEERYAEADTVVLARADVYADALAGGPLAVHLGAPLLLSATSSLSPETEAEITRLGAERAVLLGGEAALSAQVERDLEELGLGVERVSGPNRFATAASIAEELPFTSEVWVSEGINADLRRGWPDALSASAVASSLGQPILLVSRDTLPPETAEALTRDVNATIVGGTAAVSAVVAEAVDAEVGRVMRVAGTDRYATSAAVATEGLRRGLDPSITYVATGRQFADGLVAGAAAGADRGLLVLADTATLDGSPPSRTWLADHSRAFESLRLAGGTAALSERTEQQVRALLR